MDDGELWQSFIEASIPGAEWTHRAHLRVAWLHLSRMNAADTLECLRTGIRRLNASHGLVESPTRGYHETLTRVWLVLVASAMEGRAFEDSDSFLNHHPDLLDPKLPLRFYSRERVFSPEARAAWEPPDLAPLPEVDWKPLRS